MVRGIGAALLVGFALAGPSLASTRAVHFVPSALYTGKSCTTTPGLPHTGCVVEFRASADGASLRFTGTTAVDSWRCKGGGGEALIGGAAKGATRVPLVRVRSSGALFGSLGSGAHRSSVSGTLAAGGRSAKIVIHSGTAAYACHTAAIGLHTAG